MQNEKEPESPLDSLPSPQVIRDRLSKTVAETQVLRRLLRVSERAAKLRE